MKAHIPGIGGECQVGELHASSMDGTAAILIGGAKLYVGQGQWHKAEDCPRRSFPTESAQGTAVEEPSLIADAVAPSVVEPEPTQEPKHERRKSRKGKDR